MVSLFFFPYSHTDESRPCIVSAMPDRDLVACLVTYRMYALRGGGGWWWIGYDRPEQKQKPSRMLVMDDVNNQP